LGNQSFNDDTLTSGLRIRSTAFAWFFPQFQQLSGGGRMSSPTPRIDPQKMAPDEAARLLSRIAGKPISETTIRSDITRGAPTNADGSLNLVVYGAWLVRQLAEGESHGD
jgi:hypothetical protein